MDDNQYEYVVWFRNTELPPDDEDHEWPAVFVVAAPTAGDAQAWGDHLAACRVASDAGMVFVRSSVELASTALGEAPAVPVVRCGEEATDREIGW